MNDFDFQEHLTELLELLNFLKSHLKTFAYHPDFPNYEVGLYAVSDLTHRQKARLALHCLHVLNNFETKYRAHLKPLPPPSEF